MAVCSLQKPPGITTLTRLEKKPLRTYGQFVSFTRSSHFLAAPKLRFFQFGAQASAKMTLETAEAGSCKTDSRAHDVAFVAGATGKVGSRTVRELLKLGFGVRAGVRSAQKAGMLIQSVKKMKLDGEDKPVEKLEIVECDLEQPGTIGPAIGNASMVICCVGASEKEIFDITGPYRIDYQATKNLVDAATKAKVDHFILVSSLGTNKVGFPAAILNLFWGVLCWKRKAEEALIASGIPYTIVRPGGMERPTDTYKLTHNIRLSPEDTLFGGNVSNLQVAELMACMARNRRLSFCKVVEVIAETTAPLTPMEELLAKIPSQRSPPADVDIQETKDEQVVDVPAQPDSVYPGSVSTEEPPTAEAKATGTQPLSPYAAYSELKPPSSPTPTAPSGKGETIVSEPTAEVHNAISIPEQVRESKPLSPYAAYEDLKPPSSPTPSAPTGKMDVTIVDGSSKPDTSKSGELELKIPAPEVVVNSTPQSSYVVDEDLKAPGKVAAVNVSTEGNNGPVVVTPKIENVSSPITTPNSPYMAYEDLKPPSSPTPTVPKKPTMDIESKGQAITTDESSNTEHGSSGPRRKPLSPFTMYEDLKPPTSPIPSPRK